MGLHTVQLFNLWPNTLFCKHVYSSILQIQMHPRTAADMQRQQLLLTETKPFKRINDTLTHNPHKEFISAIQIMYLHSLSNSRNLQMHPRTAADAMSKSYGWQQR